MSEMRLVYMGYFLIFCLDLLSQCMRKHCKVEKILGRNPQMVDATGEAHNLYVLAQLCGPSRPILSC